MELLEVGVNEPGCHPAGPGLNPPDMAAWRPPARVDPLVVWSRMLVCEYADETGHWS